MHMCRPKISKLQYQRMRVLWGEQPQTSHWMICLVWDQSPLRHLMLHPHIQTPFRYPLMSSTPNHRRSFMQSGMLDGCVGL